MNKSTAVIYHYFEKDITYKENLIYFLNVGVLDSVNYYIVISGSCTVELPKKDNIFYLYTSNLNNDYGGYAYFIKSCLPKPYDFYIFINSSVRGPFLPSYVSKDWTQPFIEKLNSDTHLVGSCINFLPIASGFTKNFSDYYSYGAPYTHIQTAAYALSAEALNHLVCIGFYEIDEKMTKRDVILRYEIRLSREIIKKGWNISSILPLSGDMDYRNSGYSDINFSSKNGDYLYKNKFFERTLTPYELIFIKTNRNLLTPEELQSYTLIELLRCVDRITDSQCLDLIEKNQKALKKFGSYRNKILKILRFFGLRPFLVYLSRLV